MPPFSLATLESKTRPDIVDKRGRRLRQIHSTSGQIVTSRNFQIVTNLPRDAWGFVIKRQAEQMQDLTLTSIRP